MLSSLWAFLVNSPENPVPYPWERCYDLMSEVLFYKNRIDGRIVIDLRPRVNLGGGLHLENSIWHELTGHSLDRQSLSRDDQDPQFLLYSNCCSHLIYLIMPEPVHQCPICGRFVRFLG